MFGQSADTTGLRGTVLDPTGAAVAGARVSVLHAETGEKRAVQTDGQGYWEIRFLTLGRHTVVIEAARFKNLTREGVTVTGGVLRNVEATLQVGEVSEAVTVTADADLVSTGSAAIVRNVSQRELESLPTSSRNFTQLVVIEPGVSADVSELLSNNNASISPSVNGARTTNNSFVFNGIDVTNLLCCNDRVNGGAGTLDEGAGTLSRNIAPAPETLAEVKLQTALYDASTGRNGGGNFQLVSKSGGNDLHGAVYHYLQNDKLIANDFFFNAASLPRQRLQRNEGGFTLSGPVIRNKTFLFGSYQFTRANTAYVDEASNTVRLPRDLTDDRSDTGINNFAKAIGVTTASAVNPISRQLLKAKFADGGYLIPSGAGGFNCKKDDVASSCQVTTVIPATYKQDQISLNGDHNFSAANKLSAKFFFTNQPSDDPLADGDAVSRFQRREQTDQRTLSLTDTHVFGPALVNEFRAGFFRNRNDTVAIPYFTSAQFGITNPLAAERADLAQIAIDPEDVGSGFIFGTHEDSNLDIQNTFTIGNTVSWTRGRHTLRLGGEARHSQLNGNLQEAKQGNYSFESWYNFLTVGQKDSKGRARQIEDVSINYGETTRGFRMSDYSLFVADDWKVRPNLAFNLGVRWDRYGWPYERNGMLANYDISRALATGRVQDGYYFASNFNASAFPGLSGTTVRLASTKSTLETDWNNFAPRFGFSWSPRNYSSLVVRGGYGIYFERMTGGFLNSLRQSPPFFREQELNDQGDWNTYPKDRAVFPVPTFRVGFDDGEPFLATADNPDEEFEALEAQVIDPKLATPYTQQWSLNVQKEIAKDYLIEVGYVGAKGTKLLQQINANAPQDVDALGGYLARAGVPGGGFTTNYFNIVNDTFVPSKTAPCDVFDDPGDCMIAEELRVPILGFDEDEGLNSLYSNGNSIYHSLQARFQKRYSKGFTYNANYTWSKSMDTYSDEGTFQVEQDQKRNFLNRAVSDFDRTHRLVFNWTWDLPFRGNRLVSGWALSGIGTFQSGRPFSIVDGDYSGFLYASPSPRPNIVAGKTYADLVTAGALGSRIAQYLNASAVASSGAQFGNLGRNVVREPAQKRFDLSVSKRTQLTERTSLEFRGEFYNLTNTANFRKPERDLSDGDFGEITKSRGGPRVVQLGLKLRF